MYYFDYYTPTCRRISFLYKLQFKDNLTLQHKLKANTGLVCLPRSVQTKKITCNLISLCTQLVTRRRLDVPYWSSPIQELPRTTDFNTV